MYVSGVPVQVTNITDGTTIKGALSLYKFLNETGLVFVQIGAIDFLWVKITKIMQNTVALLHWYFE